jgi:nitrate/nitrite transporter NarK
VAAVVLGLGYGAAAPASTHLLVPHTPARVFNMVMSLRQIGVPLGGVLASLLLPPLVLIAGWREALLAELPAILLLTILLELPRKEWDATREPGRRLVGRALLQPFALLREAPIRRLSFASFVYSGTQLTFVAFMTVHLTTMADFDLIHAARALAIYQIAGAVTRPIWGWITDRFITPGGYTGIAYAEYAHLGGIGRTEATGLGTAIMFAGVLLIPSSFGAAVATLGGYSLAYGTLATLAFASAVLLCFGTPTNRAASV